MSVDSPRLRPFRPDGVTTSRSPSSIRDPVISAGREIAVLIVLYLAYRFGRLLIVGHEATALANAELVQQAQNWLHLPMEAVIQADIGSPDLFRIANIYYVGLHFPAMIAFLVLGYLTRPAAEYRWARNLLVLQTGLALVVHMVFPLAPPRMFPQWGFVDTMTVYGPSAYGGAAASVANQFAAMPSLHVGWAVLIAYVVLRTGPRWLAVAAVGHAGLTAAVVIVTANHWWLDGAAAIALLAVALVVFPRPRTDQPTGAAIGAAFGAGPARAEGTA
jgi:hypothetical protein